MLRCRSLLGVVLLALPAVAGAGSPASAHADAPADAHAGAQKAQGQPGPGVRDALEEYVDALRAPGVALVTLQDGTVRIEVSGVDGSGRPVGEDTRFRLASLSKAFTALAVMQQVDAGRLGLDDRLTDVLPELTMDDQRYRAITIRQLLAHRSGIWLEGDRLLDRPAGSAGEVVERLARARLEFAPGTRIQYSSVGYQVLARVVEVTAGAEFNDYLARRVLAPLGMTSTTSTSRCDAQPDGLPRGYTVVLAVRVAVPEPPGSCVGNGGVVSTARDMGVWLQFQLGDGTSPATGERLLAESSLRAMHDVPEGAYGFGWEDTGWEDTATIGHGGTLTTYNSYIEFSPQTGTGAVALTNALGSASLLTHNAITALDGGPHQDITALWDLWDVVNTVLLVLTAVVLLVAGLVLWRSRRWAARRLATPGWAVALRLLPLAVLAVLGPLLPGLVGGILGGGGVRIDITAIYDLRSVLGLPMIVVLGLVTFLGFGGALAGRLVRLRQARRTRVTPAPEREQHHAAQDA